MSVPTNVQSVALQFEVVNKNVPTAFEQTTSLLDLFEDKSSAVLEASSRNIRLAQLIRPGGKFSQGTADFDDMGPGSGSTWEVGTLTTLQLRFAIDISKLAEYATKGKERALEDVVVRENAEAIKNFKRALDCLYNTNGTGQLDTIAASYSSGTTFPVSNPDSFYYNQDIQVYPTGLASASRGLCTVTSVDPIGGTITVNAAPSGTIAGDALVINISQGQGGANPVSIEGLLYNHVTSSTGTWNNLSRTTYPVELSTPSVNANNSAITPGLRRLGTARLRKVLGDVDEPMVAYMNVDQEASWENSGLAVSQVIMNQVTGSESVDMLKKAPPSTFGGIKIHSSIHATPQRIDVILPKHWGRGITKAFGLYEEGGQTVFPVYGGSTGILAGYRIYFDTVMNVFMDQPRYGLFWSSLAKPAGY